MFDSLNLMFRSDQAVLAESYLAKSEFTVILS